MKIIVIGSIAAGVSAAARLAAGQQGVQITVYEKGGFYSCGTGGLPHYLSENLDALNKAIQGKERSWPPRVSRLICAMRYSALIRPPVR